MSAGGSAAGRDPAAIRRAARWLTFAGVGEMAAAGAYFVLLHKLVNALLYASGGVVLLVYAQILRRRAR